MEKEINFSINTEPKYFIDWFYERYFSSAFRDKNHKFPPKITPYLYKPVGTFCYDDPIPLIMKSEREIDGRVYKGTINLRITTISLHPFPRIDVKASFVEDEFFLPFFRMLAGIGGIYREAETTILSYVNKNIKEYKALNDKYHEPIPNNTILEYNRIQEINIAGKVENSTIINGNNNVVMINWSN